MRSQLILVLVFGALVGVSPLAWADSIQTYSDVGGDTLSDDDDSDGWQEWIDNDDQQEVGQGTTSITLDIGGPYSIAAGGTLSVDVTVSASVPLDIAVIGFFLGDEGTVPYLADFYDGYLLEDFQSGTTYTVEIAPSFFSDSNWDLDSAGTYGLHARLWGPEISSSAVSTTVTVSSVPEPGTLALLGLGMAGLGWHRRRKMNAS